MTSTRLFIQPTASDRQGVVKNTLYSSLAFAAFAIVMATSAFYFLFVAPADPKEAMESTARNNPVYLLLWLTLYGWAGLLVARDILRRGITKGALPLLAFAALAIVSIFWSAGAGRTFIYASMLAANFIIGYALAAAFPPRRFLPALGIALTMLMLLSLALLTVAPELATSTRYGGAWLGERQFQGVFAHKSDAGYYFGALSLIIAHGRFGRPLPVLRSALFGLTLGAILLSNSATALGAALVLNLLLVIANRTAELGPVILPTAAIGAIVFSIALPFIDIGAIAGLFGREASLTGRVPIWNAGLPYVLDKPLLGYGYSGFFDLSTYSPVWQFWQQFPYFRTPHFHNTGLEIVIGLGIIGLAAYIVVLFTALTVFANRSIDQHTANLLGAILILFVISASFDFTLLKHNAFATTFLAYVCVAAQRDWS